MEIYAYDMEMENVTHMIAIHKNTHELSKWNYEVNEGDILFQMQKLSSVIKIDAKSYTGDCRVTEANILIIYSDKF